MIEHIVLPEERMRRLRADDRWRVELDKFVDVNVKLYDDVVIEGEDVFQVIRVEELFKAFGRGFAFSDCLNLLDEDYMMSVMEIKEFSKSKNRETILKGRVIGEKGTTKKQIEKSANVRVAIYGKTISIIGKPANIKVAEEAIAMILFGGKHNKVYRFLQERKVV